MALMVLAVVALGLVTGVIALTSRTSDPGHAQPADRDRAATNSDGPGTKTRDRASRPSRALTGYRFPSPATTGVPAGWKPAQTKSSDLTITEPGTVVEDVRFTNGASIVVEADNVTIRRVDMQGGIITNQYGDAPANCGHQLLVEDTTFEQIPGKVNDGAVIGEGSYTARRIEVDGRGEGPRLSDCGPVTVEDSFISIHSADPGTAACEATHADGFQAFHGRGGTFRNNTVIFESECGTSPYFMGSGVQSSSEPAINTGTYNIDRMLVGGISGYPFRQQVPGSITGLRIVDKSWIYGPIDNRCSALSPWDAKIVTIDANYRVTGIVRNQRCDTNS
jgi:hypothetical protein